MIKLSTAPTAGCSQTRVAAGTAFWTVGLVVLCLLGDGAMAPRPSQRHRN